MTTLTSLIGDLPPLDKVVETMAGQVVSGPDDFQSINDLITFLARTIPDSPLIAYPESELGAADFKDYTARDLDSFADEAAKRLSFLGLKPSRLRADEADVIAMLGPSTMDYVVSILALSRMGFTILFLSTRLPADACIALLQETKCVRIVSHVKSQATVAKIQEGYGVQSFGMPDHSVWNSGRSSGPRFQRETELLNESDTAAFIVHSSGSTGYPKPIYQSHRHCLNNYSTGAGMRAFVTNPLYHNHGICMMFRGMYQGKRVALYNANLPITNSHLVAAMRAAAFESFHCVPYALKVLAETEEGIEELAKAKLVLFGGSSCPDELGDLLVSRGVYLVGHYGATEVGQLMTSQRDANDHSWNYLRPLKTVRPYLFFDEVGPGIFETVVLDGLPTKTQSNSDNPPNSYRTRDTFTKHPTLPDRWKYLGRLDDRVTLFNGEKVLPIPFEHRVRQSDLVQDCVVFGVSQAFPGLLVFPSTRGTDLNQEEFLDRLWPTIQNANEKAEQFGRVSREMVKVIYSMYPSTDKGTIIRAACYKQFEREIEAAYQNFELIGSNEKLNLDVADLERYLTKLLSQQLGVEPADLASDADLFAAGIDSLQAITARATIVREIDLGGKMPGQNVVFDHPEVAQLAKYLHSLRTGSALETETEEDTMRKLVSKYSNFTPFKPGVQFPVGEVVVLTGATGSLGAHILSQLVSLPHVRHVYCLVRASSPEDAHKRVLDSLDARGLRSGLDDDVAHQRIVKGLGFYPRSSRFTALPADLGRTDLGLGTDVYTALKSVVTSVIHSAWAVNFTIRLHSFEAQHIAGLRNLLDLCLSVPFARPARMAFISSISVAAGTPAPAHVPETLVSDITHVQPMGYARSKWVAEQIIYHAATSTGIDARALRSGQIIGDSIAGRWNATEAIPLMIRSAETLGALPSLNESPSWIPVDRAAAAVLELAHLDAPGTQASGYFQVRDEDDVVYHVQNPRCADWSTEILPALAAAGLQFEVVSQREWVKRLREGEQDPAKNPTVKLVDFFTEKYDNSKPGRRGLVYETRRTETRSKSIAAGFDLVGSDLLKKCVRSWKERDWN